MDAAKPYLPVNVRMDMAHVDAIDDWRRAQRKIVSRSEAIRVLTLKGLEVEHVPAREPAAP